MSFTPRRIVTITPLPADRDSRTLKIAQSFARMGHESIIVENRPSRSAIPDVQTITLAGGGRVQNPGGDSSGGEDFPTRIKARLNPWVPRGLGERAHFCTYLAAYYFFRPLTGLIQIPPADLYYLHEYRLYPMVRAIKARRQTPFIYDAHDFYPAVFNQAELSEFWRRRFLPLIDRMEERCIKDAAAVVTTSQGMVDLYRQRYGVEAKVLSNRHDARIERAPARNVREAAGLGADAFLVVVIGNRKPGLAVDKAIEALTQLPGHVHLAFVGRYHEETPAIAARLGVENRVHAVGAVAPEEVVPFVRAADVALLPYYPATANVESFLPNGFFHSVSAGLQLLYPGLPEFKRIIGATNIGREIDARDAKTIAAGIDWILSAGGKNAEMRQRLDDLSNDLSWENQEKDLARYVEDALATKRAPDQT